MRLLVTLKKIEEIIHLYTCGVLRDLVPFVQFPLIEKKKKNSYNLKNVKKTPWRRVPFSKDAGFSLQLY